MIIHNLNFNKMKKTDKILIESKEQVSKANILALHDQASKMQNAVNEYNNIDPLQDLGTPEEILHFLSNPQLFFEQHIISDLEINIKSKVNPSLKGICNLFDIDFNRLQNVFVSTPVNDLDKFEVKDLKVTPTSAAIKEAEESGKIYLTDPEEIKEFQHVQELCDKINEYAERYKIHSSDLQQLKPHLKLTVKSIQNNWVITPDYRIIRNFLKNGKLVSL
jgi:hypothetical protein